MTPTLAVVMVLMGIAIGWIARGWRVSRRDAVYLHESRTPTADELTAEQLHALLDASVSHQETLRVTMDLYLEIRQLLRTGYQPLDSMSLRPTVAAVYDGSENVKLIDGVWTFVPSSERADMGVAERGAGRWMT